MVGKFGLHVIDHAACCECHVASDASQVYNSSAGNEPPAGACGCRYEHALPAAGRRSIGGASLARSNTRQSFGRGHSGHTIAVCLATAQLLGPDPPRRNHSKKFRNEESKR